VGDCAGEGRARPHRATTTPHPDVNALDLPGLREHLLRDRDGDGLPDALSGPIWIARGRGPAAVDAGVAAAAEFLSPLAERAMVLEVDAQVWDAPGCGFAIGDHPPASAEAPTALLYVTHDGVVAHATDADELHALIGVAGRHSGAGHGTCMARGAAAAGTPEVSGGRTAAPEAAVAGPVAVRAIGLGSLLHGDDGQAGATPYGGSRDHPERFAGGFAPGGGVPEALGVALRLALAGRDTPERVCAAPEDAALRTAVDPALPLHTWSLRRRSGSTHRFELVGHDKAALAAGCRWFATSSLAMPDGQRLDDLEDGLTSLVRGETRHGRLAAAADAVGAARVRGATPVAVELPSPPASAPLRLGLPVANSARDGERRQWRLEAPWEGERLLDAAARLLGQAGSDLVGAGPLQLEAFASETLAIRCELGDRLGALARQLSVAIEVLPVRHAFRPALHWLLEEVAPLAPTAARRLRVEVARQPERFGPSDRWLRELYPVAELLAQRHPGLEVELELLAAEAEAPTYRAVFFDADDAGVLERELAPVVVVTPHPAGGDVLVTSGGVRLRRAGGVVASERVVTDAEAFWGWFTGEVLPAVARTLDAEAAPLLAEIAVVASLSEPDDLLPIDHETDSVLEVLHEEVYFGVLEAFERACGGAAPRSLGVGRVLPFFRNAPGAPLRARVTVRESGSDRLGTVTRGGAWIAAPRCNARVVVRAVHGRDLLPTGIELDLVGEADDVGGALMRLRWSAAQPDAPWPRGAAIWVVSGPDGGVHRAGDPTLPPGTFQLRPAEPLPPPPESLPDRPLHPHELVRYARAWGARHGAVRVATPRETALGQPLVVIEVTDPERAAFSRARASAWRPTLLVSARQHANEATSTQAVLRWLEAWSRDETLHRRANLVLHPLENPDGARLHAACCALAPNHMHHAARYTAFGADLQADPRVRGEVIAESLMRHDAARRWRPIAHLNDHGYPAHAWIRSLSGFVPRGFGDWSLPMGHLTILTTHGSDDRAADELRERLAAAAEAALRADAEVHRHTLEQTARSCRYRVEPATPTTLRSGLPFWLRHRPPGAGDGAQAPIVRDGPDRSGPLQALTPLVSLITEVPDETVRGEAWQRCVRTHERVNDAVTRALLAWLPG